MKLFNPHFLHRFFTFPAFPFPISPPPPSHIPTEQHSRRRMGVAVSPLQFLSAISSISHFFLLLHGSLPRAAVPQDKPTLAWFSCPGPQLLPGPCSCGGSPCMQLPLGHVHPCQCGVQVSAPSGSSPQAAGKFLLEFPMAFPRLCREHLLPLSLTLLPSLLTVGQ